MRILIFEERKPVQVFTEWVHAYQVPPGTLRHITRRGCHIWAECVLYTALRITGDRAWEERLVETVPAEYKAMVLLLT